MVELGKPIHTFDAAAVHDGRIVVRRATAGERLETLDHVERELDPETLVIADPAGPLGIAGVMGGAASEIGDGTTDVVVESAIFDPVSIRRTAFRYALRSEASLRFEKGQEFRLARLGADRTARLIAEWAGGTVAPGVVDSDPGGAARRPASRSGRPGSTACSGRTLDGRRAARAAGPGRDRDRPRPAPGRAIPVAAGTRAARRRAGRGRGRRGDRPDLAPRPRDRGRHRRGGHPRPRLRARPADAARTRRCRRTATIRWQLRDAVRETLAGAGLTEVVTYALVAPRARSSGSRRTTTARSTASRSSAPRAARSRSRTRSRASTRSCARASSAACSRSSSTNLRHGPRRRRDLRGRQGLRRDRRRHRRTSGGASASR